MVDINNIKDLNRIKNIAKSNNGKAMLEFYQEQLNNLDYDKIEIEQPFDRIAGDYLAIRKSRKFLKDIIDLLTPEKGD